MPEKAKETTPKKAESESSDVYVKYNGRASVRSLSKSDFESKGITDQGDVEFNQENHWCAAVSPEAAGLLVGMGEFVKSSKDEANPSEQKPVQQVPAPGEVIPGEKQGSHTPLATQDQADSQKKS